MALVALNVRKARFGVAKSGKLYDSVEWAVDDTAIKLAAPSVCKKDGASDGLVNSHVNIEVGKDVYDLWCTQTVTEILALS